MDRAFGLDIGGTGIKGGIVDLATGEIVGERFQRATPQPATVNAVIDTVAEIVRESGWAGPIGCTFPAIVQHGVVHSAANVDPGWVGVHLAELLSARLLRPVTVLNDADAAGVAEMQLGAGRGTSGVVLAITLGTGIGSALFTDGHLVPNTELGHLELDGFNAESRAATSARVREHLSYEEWAVRLQRYFSHVERLFSPDLFIVGGSVSQSADKFLPLLDLRARTVPAELRQNSGIVGAALWAQHCEN